MSTFVPSKVDLKDSAIPLVATFGKAESEHAAALMVGALVALGDEWRPLTPGEIGKFIEQAVGNKQEPFYGLRNNPFFKPNFFRLAADGYAVFTGKDDTLHVLGQGASWRTVAFTEKGIEALRNRKRRAA